MSVPTAHNNAKQGDFAKTVLMPGDPLRSEFIAKTFLTDAVLVNDVRGVHGYTGFYKGKRVSVMASGMGMPSMGIYSYELFNFYDVDSIIRVGSAGALSPELHLRDIVIAEGACTDGNYLSQYKLSGFFAPIADFSLLKRAAEYAEEHNLSFKTGNVLSSDFFYNASNDTLNWNKLGVLAVEMETAALYANAAAAGKKALSVLTISDSLVTGEELSSSERQDGFFEMAKLALEIAR